MQGKPAAAASLSVVAARVEQNRGNARCERVESRDAEMGKEQVIVGEEGGELVGRP